MSDWTYYDDLKGGEKGTTPRVTVTKEMIRAYADLTGDHTPVHIDEDFARKSHFGGIVAHGLLGLALTDGLKCQSDLQFPPGASLGWECDFTRPIYAGDVLHCEFTVGFIRMTSKPDWGIVHLESELFNQRGEVVQRGRHKLMILRNPEAGEAVK
ncbi:MaoC family dehydratase [Phaeovulum sp.]|uniref:MaoC family dehydratase n=1 Tax=Phaeovulum sp. TaxID=2934796 RepID=UPI002731950E|nr:MaoC family dehydratase [Phaeovulum sp.]MDP1668197.1 MaoC family dehydratase [Phaeovulum sp.]MDP3862446.1 MaoC family dehydratase [Phaeovulum sp.]MDZ4118046.1 MaoC family dehydratase [Phaeovulum sp.]